MNKSAFIVLLYIVFSILFFSCDRGNKTAQAKLIPFSLHDVRLTNSPFKHAMELDEKWLLSFQPDRFLSGFRSESGLKPKAPKYGGWESQGVAGQTFGHYLSALSMMYASTGNEELNDRIKYSINELDTCQQAFDLFGLVAAFPRAKQLFQEITVGDIRTEGFDLNGGWVPLYTMHKLFAGLIDVYKYTGNKQAYRVLIHLADGLEYMLKDLTEEQVQRILICEHGGINESLAEVYAFTGDKKYFELARRLNHHAILDPLMNKEDDLAGKHANTQIPKVIGLMRQYELSGDTRELTGAEFFWNTVVYHHSYVIGGNSEAEHFGVPNRTYDRITDKTCENCNTYNMLKLTKHLFKLNPMPEHVDYYERALYNQILASQNPNDGMVCYMSPLASGSQRWFSTPFDSFWCCVGTGIENHARYGEFIYFSDKKNNLYVNLFIPSILDWKERNVIFTQQTDFPASDTISYVVKTEKTQRFVLNLRMPAWSQSYRLFINDEAFEAAPMKGYITIDRQWKDGDRISYVLSQSFRSEEALGDSMLRAYLYGPIVLSAEVKNLSNKNRYPVVVTDDLRNALSVLELSKEPLRFLMKTSQPFSVKMKPYYQTADEPVMVYFEHYKTKDWKENSASILMKQNHEKWLKERMISQFTPGEMQPERDHDFKGENLEIGEIEGRKYRKALNGWFSFDMKILPDVPLDLSATFWGNLGDIYKFEIEIDGVSVATVIIHWWGNKFVEKIYHIPFELSKGKNNLRIKFKALNENSVAGPLFDCKILKQ